MFSCSTAAENPPPYSHSADVEDNSGTRYECVKYTNDPEGTPRNRRDAPFRICRLFHPTCGDLTPAGNRLHSLGQRPSPATSGASSLEASIHCMPRQIPRKGTLP